MSNIAQIITRLYTVPLAEVLVDAMHGDHRREVLRGELGITEEEYQALVATGITGTLDDVARYTVSMKESS